MTKSPATKGTIDHVVCRSAAAALDRDRTLITASENAAAPSAVYPTLNPMAVAASSAAADTIRSEPVHPVVCVAGEPASW